MRKYTRIGTFLLALVMCLTMLTTQAESKLPLEVADLFTVKAWAHYAIADHPGMPENKAFAVMQEKSGYEAVLLVMRNTKSETNVLVLAEKSSAQADWKITMRNWGAVGQGDANVPQLAVLADGHFVIHYPNGDSAYFTHEANGWQLTNLSFGDTTQVEVSRSGMTFLVRTDNGKWVKTTVSGVVETAMAQFSMGSLPADGRGGTRAPDESADDSGFPVELDVPLRLPAAFAVRQTCGRQAVCGVFRAVGYQFPRGERQSAAVHERLGAGFLRGGRLSACAVRHQPPSVPHRVHQGGCGVEFVGSGGNRQLGELPGASSAHIGAHRRPAEFLRRGDDADGGTAGDVSGSAGSGMGVCGDDDDAGAADSRLRGIE